MAERARELIDQRDRRLASGLDGGLDGTWLVEAGAGTGKTTVLVERIVATIAAGVPFDRVVAITFTEKAAAELRLRVREKLESLADPDSGDSPAELVPVIQRGAPDLNEEEATATLEKRLRDAIHTIDRAEIGTIHGFATRILRERPIEAGIDPGFQIAESLTREILLDEAWDEWIRNELASDDIEDLATNRRFGVHLKRIREIAVDLVRHRDLVHLAPEPGAFPDVRPLHEAFLDGASRLEALVEEHCRDESDGGAQAVRDFVRAARDAAFVPDHALPAFLLNDVSPAPGPTQGNQKNWDDGALAEARELAAGLAEEQQALRSAAGHHAAAGLLHWLTGFVEAFQNLKRDRSFMDFEDLLIEARNLLRDNRGVRGQFKRSFDRVFIDEFQDTDPLQCEIAFFLSEEREEFETDWRNVRLELGKLFIVGDPKQSIYRFRRADIEVYEEAKRVIELAGRGDGRSGGVLHLSQNFRTRPAVVTELNEAFRDTMVAPEGPRQYQPDYEDLNAFRDDDGRGPGVVLLAPPVNLGESEGEGPRGRSNTTVLRSLEASTVAAFLTGLIDEEHRVFDKKDRAWRPVRLSDIAVLFKTMTGLEQYEDAFEAHGIEYRIAGGKRYYARREVRELATVLLALEDPHDTAAVVGALRTPFFGVPDDALLLHRRAAGGFDYLSKATGDERVEEAFGLLRQLHHARDSRRTPAVIEELFRVTGILELYLMKPSGEQRYANLRKAVELATALGKRELLSFGGFARWLEKAAKMASDESESPLAEEGDEFVRMLTIHKSKGLEYPIVVLADLCGRSRSGSQFIVDRGAGELSLRVSKGLGIATENDEQLRKLESEREAAERVRLMYVATTRARDLVIVPWFLEKAPSRSCALSDIVGLHSRAGDAIDWPGGKQAPGTVLVDTGQLERERPRPAPVRVDLETALSTDPEATQTHGAKREWSARMAALATTTSADVHYVTPSSLAHEEGTQGLRPPAGPDLTAEPPDDTSFSGADVGVLVHSVLQWIDLRKPDDAEGLARSLAGTMGLSDGAVRDAVALVRRALGTTTLERAARARSILREAPFCVKDGSTFTEGKIDLVFEDGDGLVIVDYKTDAVPEGGTDALASAYRRQAEAYAAAVERVAGRAPSEVLLLALRADEPEVPLR